MNNNQNQFYSWIVFFSLMAFVSYYFVLIATNISNDYPEYTALADRLRGEPLSYSFERELTGGSSKRGLLTCVWHDVGSSCNSVPTRNDVFTRSTLYAVIGV